MSDNNQGHAKHKSFYEEGGTGIMSWVVTLDHKRIGLMYLAAVLTMFFVGGVMALLVRLELFSPGKTLLTAHQ
jgi:cytochrome c oxidase subunit I